MKRVITLFVLFNLGGLVHAAVECNGEVEFKDGNRVNFTAISSLTSKDSFKTAPSVSAAADWKQWQGYSGVKLVSIKQVDFEDIEANERPKTGAWAKAVITFKSGEKLTRFVRLDDVTWKDDAKQGSLTGARRLKIECDPKGKDLRVQMNGRLKTRSEEQCLDARLFGLGDTSVCYSENVSSPKQESSRKVDLKAVAKLEFDLLTDEQKKAVLPFSHLAKVTYRNSNRKPERLYLNLQGWEWDSDKLTGNLLAAESIEFSAAETKIAESPLSPAASGGK